MKKHSKLFTGICIVIACILPNYSVQAIISSSTSSDVKVSNVTSSTASILTPRVGINADFNDYANLTGKKEIALRGWALNESKVKQVDIYLDGKFKSRIYTNLLREDIKVAYPNYPNSLNSGFAYKLGIDKIVVGTHLIEVLARGYDNSSAVTNIHFKILNLEPKVLLNDIPSLTKDKKLVIGGYALNKSGMSQVKVYIDGIYKGNATYGLSTPDVNSTYSGYPSGDKSGFSFTSSITDLSIGKHTVKIIAVGKDAGNISIEKSFTVLKLTPIVGINADFSDYANLDGKKEIALRGWALNDSKVKQVDVYLDGKFKSRIYTNVLREDVKVAYPNYPNSPNSGFAYKLGIVNIPAGTHLIEVLARGYDNSSALTNIHFKTGNLEPRVSLNDIPSLAKDKKLVIGGYALNKSGMSQVKVYIDGIYKGDATYGLSTIDVNSTYSGYPSGDKSGFSFTSSITDLSTGKHTIKITAVGNDASDISIEKSFDVLELSPLVGINADFSDYADLTGKKVIALCGWALNDSMVKQVDVYLDGKFKSRIYTNVLREDVKATYPNYPDSLNSGFVYNLDIDNIGPGTHLIEALARGYDNSSALTNIHFKTQAQTQKTIVIDAGHNYGGDDGAYKTILGVTYVERNLNMQLALKVKYDLVQYGFNVIMTRNENDVSLDDTATSLKKRVDIANNAKADLFLSIHHDASLSSGVSGISAHYSTYRPNLDKSGIVVINDISYDTTPTQAAVESASLAQQLVNSLATLGYVNRGISDHNLYVTKNTNMPSILVECGFITNQAEAAKSANDSQQDLFASKMALAVNNFFK